MEYIAKNEYILKYILKYITNLQYISAYIIGNVGHFPAHCVSDCTCENGFCLAVCLAIKLGIIGMFGFYLMRWLPVVLVSQLSHPRHQGIPHGSQAGLVLSVPQAPQSDSLSSGLMCLVFSSILDICTHFTLQVFPSLFFTCDC